MLYIKKYKPPNSFVHYVKQPNVHFDDMDTEVKQELRLSLLLEQGWLCAYCMKRLSFDGNDVKIEHYEPRNTENELKYENLLAVCKGGEGSVPERQTCDTRKGNQVLNINPQRRQDIDTVSYTSNGDILSSDNVFQADFDDILNLNDRHGYLVKNRRQALISFQKEIYKKLHGKHASADFWQNCLLKYEKCDRGVKVPYLGIILWYIRKKCGIK